MARHRAGASPGTPLRVLAAHEQDLQELDARATTFQAEIERRLAEGPAEVMDFAALKRSLRWMAEREGRRPAVP